MHIVIAPDSFKGSLHAVDVATAMQQGMYKVFPSATFDLIPIADGGEGTVVALVSATKGCLHTAHVHDPLGRKIEAVWGLSGDGCTAFVEMAAASGLPLLKGHERNPLKASTYGTGELLREALLGLHASVQSQQGTASLPRLIIGIGGSATNDGGMGALKALGVKFYGVNDSLLLDGAENLQYLARVDATNIHPLLEKTEILVACDVDNPLCGERGASAIFGPQKGADVHMVTLLDGFLERYATVCSEATGKDIKNVAGAGAAGGLGAGLLFFTNAQLVAGVELVLNTVDFATRVAKADLVITGEGKTDVQTQYGKAPVGVAKVAKKYGKPVLCISGILGQGAEHVLNHGIDILEGVCPLVEDAHEQQLYIEKSMQHAASLLENTVARVCCKLRL